MYTVQLGIDFPIAIRYPRGRGHLLDWKKPFENIEIGKGECLKQGTDLAFLSIGTMSKNVEDAIIDLDVSHYDMQFVKPLDEGLLHEIFKTHKIIVTIEDGTIVGGFGSSILAFANSHNYKQHIEVLGIADEFIEQGTVLQLQQLQELDSASITKKIEDLLTILHDS